jgi:hypothetical protein
MKWKVHQRRKNKIPHKFNLTQLKKEHSALIRKRKKLMQHTIKAHKCTLDKIKMKSS